MESIVLLTLYKTLYENSSSTFKILRNVALNIQIIISNKLKIFNFWKIYLTHRETERDCEPNALCRLSLAILVSELLLFEYLVLGGLVKILIET